MASVEVLYLQGVQTGQKQAISCYFAGADAAGYIVPVSQSGPASSTSPRGFKVAEPSVIRTMTGPASGVLQVLADGIVTPIRLDLVSVLGKKTDGNARWGNLAGGGTEYSLKVEQAMA